LAEESGHEAGHDGPPTFDPFEHPTSAFNYFERIIPARKDASGRPVIDPRGHVVHVVSSATVTMLFVAVFLAVLCRLATRRLARIPPVSEYSGVANAVGKLSARLERGEGPRGLLRARLWVTKGLLTLLPPRGLQVKLELVCSWLAYLCRQVIGPTGERYVSLVGSLFIFIFCMSMLAVVPGGMSPTANLNITVALALTVFVAVQVYGFRAHGLGYLKHFADGPWWLWWLMIPVHILGELARPVSLSFRLFGNIFGEDTAICIFVFLAVMLMRVIPVPLPLQIPMLAFAVFGAVIQALVFSMLTAVYIGGAVGHVGEER
jgi:F-type H+-transporting ATPase subunit a